MSSKSFISSAVMHGIVLSLMAMDFSLANLETHRPPPAILMVDLTKVQVSDKTNLPPAQNKKTTPKPKVAEAPVKKPEKVKSTQVSAPKPITPPKPQPKPQEPAKAAAPVIEQKSEKAKKETKKSEPQKALEPPQKETKKAKTYDMKSLLASVDKVRKSAPQQTTNPDKTTDPPQNSGIDGGTGGSFSQILTISERDLIANQLKKCWYVDAGAKEVENTIIEIRASVNKAGRVKDVKIVNAKSGASFKSLAEGARRAVWICDEKGEESPFRILAEKYAGHYNDWKELYLRFNPVDGGIF